MALTTCIAAIIFYQVRGEGCNNTTNSFPMARDLKVASSILAHNSLVRVVTLSLTLAKLYGVATKLGGVYLIPFFFKDFKGK